MGNSEKARPSERERSTGRPDGCVARAALDRPGRSQRPRRQLRSSDGHRGRPQPPWTGRAPGQPPVRRDRRPPLRGLAGRSRRAGRPGAARRTGLGPGGTARARCQTRRPVGGDLRQRRRPGGRRGQPARGRVVAGRGRRDGRLRRRLHGLRQRCPRGAGPSVTSRPTRCRPGRSPWSRTRALRSRPCCAVIAGSASPSRSPPGRSSSPRPRTTWATPSTNPRRAWSRCCWRPCAHRSGCVRGWPARPSRACRSSRSRSARRARARPWSPPTPARWPVPTGPGRPSSMPTTCCGSTTWTSWPTPWSCSRPVGVLGRARAASPPCTTVAPSAPWSSIWPTRSALRSARWPKPPSRGSTNCSIPG